MVPVLKSVMHCVFAEDDLFPQLMGYTEVTVPTVTEDTAAQVNTAKCVQSSSIELCLADWGIGRTCHSLKSLSGHVSCGSPVNIITVSKLFYNFIKKSSCCP